MSYFITTLVVVVFLFIVLKKRVIPALSRLLRTLRGRPETAVSLYRPGLPGPPERIRFEVLAFFVSEAVNSVELRERIEMKLNNAVRKLEDAGVSFDIQYMTAGDALVIILSSRKAERSAADGNGSTGRTAAGTGAGN